MLAPATKLRWSISAVTTGAISAPASQSLWYASRLARSHALTGTQGVGRGFCAGADLGGLDSMATGQAPGSADSPAPPPDASGFLLTKRLYKPVIAAINGPVAGIGFAWALTCDVRFANRDANPPAPTIILSQITIPVRFPPEKDAQGLQGKIMQT